MCRQNSVSSRAKRGLCLSHCPKPGFKDLILTLPKSQNNLPGGGNCISIIKKIRSLCLNISYEKESTQLWVRVGAQEFLFCDSGARRSVLKVELDVEVSGVGCGSGWSLKDFLLDRKENH